MINVEMTKAAGVTLATENTICNDNVNVTIAHSENLIAENIKKDVQIADVVGTLESGGDKLAERLAGRLTTYEIPNTITAIPNYAFYNYTQLKNITIPDSVTSIGNSAFYNCRGLRAIRIPHGCKTIGDSAFYYCDDARTLYLPNTLTSVSNNAFWNCNYLSKITIENGYNCSTNLSAADDFYESEVAEWFTALADRTGLSANKIIINSSLFDDLSSNTIAIATNKNWTVLSG